MVTGNTSQADDTTAFLRAVRSGNLERVIEFLDTDLDINTANSNGLNALHLASKDGHVEIVTELLKRGAKVDAATRKGNTALHIASLAGQAEVVSILIQYGAAVNIQSQNGFTPLYMAAQENQDEVVKLLLSNEANQSLATEDGFTPLAVAMQQGHDKVVSVLLENDSKGKVRLPALHIAAKKDDCKAADLLLQNDHKPDVTSKSGFTPLHIAAHYGNEEVARLLIKRGADVNHLAKHNISPLHVAAKWNKNNMVKVLLENSAQIDVKTRDGLTPLHCAARSGHEQVITTLLEHSAPISARTKSGLAPLHMASQGDHVEAARVLLYHRASVHELTIDYLTSLHVSAHCGHVRVAKLLLDRKADVNARALNGFTPLHIACKKNRIKVVELLLKHGASIESTTESGLTPLHVASFMGCMNIVIFLLQHEANPDVPTVRGETPLHLAARANQTDIIRILLRNGAKVDARAREQQTPLHIASRLGNIDIVMLLLQYGAAVDTATKDMYTALHIAAKEGQEEVTAILVENNASLKATTKNGFTPLHIAAKYGNVNVANILLQRSSKLDAQGKNDISPLHLACHYDHPNVVNLLLEKGASPHIVSQNGHTPLHIAARKNQMEIASTLLESGAEANAESKAGFTPLHLSAQKGHYDMTNLLIEHGADPNHKSKNGLSALHLCAQEDFIRVASILVENGANVETETETGYRPIHVAAHFGHLSMIRFLLIHNADINVKTNQNYTPLHQAAQQGHAHVVTALLKGNASHKARTNDGLTALNIAQKLGYISVMEVLKGLSYDTLSPDNKNWDEKYKVIAPESLQETNFMSDSDDEGGSDALINEQPYRYLTADLMKNLRDDSLPIDVTRDDPVYRQVTKEGKQEFTQSNNYCLAENFDTDGFNLGRLHFRSFLVSFLVDARGGAMKGCRHSGVRIIVPPRRATMPIRVTCRLVKPSKVANPPPLMEGEALATRIIEMGPVGATFLGPVLIDIPHFASIRGKEREIIILRSENGETWKEHDNSVDNDETLLNTPYDPQMSATHSGRITRIITTDFPQYFATVTRIKQEVHVIGAEGGILISSVANHVQAVFPPGALTKKIKVGLQAHVIPAELTAKLLGNCVAVSPIITIEPRRRKFHKPITLTIPVPQAANKGMINQYGGETPTLRLLCSIAGGTSESQWEDVTGSTPLTFMNDKVSFTTTVSARFWLMDCRNIGAVSRMATELYEESLYVPYIINFVIYSKRMDALEATLRILCMTDGKEGMHTLERQEEFVEIVKSRDVEALDGKDLYIEFSGNLVPVTKSGVQLKFTFKAFRQNRLSFHVKVKDPLLDPVARMLFMREPKVAKGEPPQQPICVLNIVLPETSTTIEAPKKAQDYEDSNIINQKIDSYESKYQMDGKEKIDELKEISPSESKFITDTLQKERTDAVTIHESLAQKVACPLESVDASYPSKVVGDEQDLSSTIEIERQTYKEKRKFWEDISKKRESYQRSESDVSRTSELTLNESDSQYMQNVATEDTEITSEIEKSGTMEDLNVPDISECSVAEKAHYFEEQIQKEITKVVPKLQISVKSEKEKLEKTKSRDKEKVDEDERYISELKEVKKGDKRKEISLEMKDQKGDRREEVKKGVCKQLSNKEDKDHTISRDELLTHVGPEDIVSEKTDKPEKLKEDIEKVDHSTYVQSALEEIATKKKDEIRKLQKHAEQTIEYKEQASIHTAEMPLERIKQVEKLHVESMKVDQESPVSIKDQLVESKVEDVTKQQPKVIDTIQKRHKDITSISSEIHLVHSEEIQKIDREKTQLEIQTIPTDMSVKQESTEYVEEKLEDVKKSITEINVDKALMKDVKEKQEEVKKSVTEIKVVHELMKDAKEKGKEVKESITEVKVEKEIVKDAQEKEKEVKESITEVKVEKEIVKDAKEKEKEVKESITEVKVEKEIVKDAQEKEKEVKESITEVKVEKEIVKDAKEKEKEVEKSITEVKVEQEIVKEAKEKQKEVKESVTEIRVEQEVMKDAKGKEKEVKESITETKVEQEMVKDAKDKQEEVKESIIEKKVKQEVVKDGKEKEEEVKESVTEIKVDQVVIKDAKEKQEEVKESISETKLEQEVVKDAKGKQEEIKESITETKVEQEIVKDTKDKQKEVKESVTEAKVEQEVVKDKKEKEIEVKESVTEIKVEQTVIKDAKEKQEGEKDSVTERKVETVLVKDKGEIEVPKSLRDVSAQRETVKVTKEKEGEVQDIVSEVRVEQVLSKEKEEKQKDLEESCTDVSVQRDTVEDVKSVRDSLAGVSAKVEIPSDIKTKHKEVIQSITDVSIQKERPGGLKIEKQDSIKEISSGRRIITEETTIIYKVQKDGTLVQEQVLKSVQIGGAAGSVGALSGIPRDTNILETMTSKELFEIQSLDTVKPETITSVGVDSEIQKFLEGKRKMELEPVEQGRSLEMLKKLPLVQETITKEMVGTTELKREDAETFVKEEPVTDIDTKHIKKESRIPISTAKVEKDKVQKEIKLKTSLELKQSPSKPENLKDLSSELLDSISPTGKKKEFESRIPKRVVDVKATSEKPGQKDTHIKKESETYTITEKKLSEEVTSKLEERLTTKSETQTFSKTFTDPQDAFKMFEDMDNMKKDFATVTSTVDHKSSSVLEKKEVISSEVCSGTDKIITLEEKERVEKKKSSESQMKKESPTETMEQKKSKREELDKTAIQKMSMNLTDTQEVIDATASESRAETKKEETFKKLSDETGTMTREAGSSMLRESDAEVAIRIKKDVSEETSDKDGIQIIEEKTSEEGVFKPVADFDNIEKIVRGESHKETKESFDVTQFVPSEKIIKAKVSLKEDAQTEQIVEQIPPIESLEERQRQKLKELEARTIAESLIKSIENEIEAKSTTDLKAELLSKGYSEKIARDGIETDHEKLADDLTRKFESIMKKSVDKQTDQILTEQQRSKIAMQEELYEKGSTRDSISVSEDITKDEESSPHEKEESFPLSSSQVKLQDRNITLSPSSISEQIDFEETIDVDTNELEDILKSTVSPQFEKQQSDKYGQMELQRDFHSEESFPRDKIVSEISDVRVLEVLEPGAESQSRQDSVDVPSLEMDEHKISEQTSRGIPSLHESADTDSFERIVQERDITISPSTVSEDTNVDSSLIQEHVSSVPSQKDHELVSTQRTDSFEFESSPVVSPKSKVQGLEIKSVDWMIGEEKIEISEVLQPSQIFNQELEAYESMQKKEGLSSHDGSTDYDQESCTKSSEDVSMIESIKETCTDDGREITSAGKGSKFTVIPISEQDFESELVENKLDVSCQELVDTLQREYDAKTPIKEYVESIQFKIPDEQTVESEKRKEEPVQVEEQITEEQTDVIASTEVDAEKSSEQTSEEMIKSDVPSHDESLKESEDEQKMVEAVLRSEIKLKLEKVRSAIKGGKSAKEVVQEIMESDKISHMDDVLKEWSEVYLSDVKPLSDAYIEYKRHIVKATEKPDTAGKSVTVPSDTCALKTKKEDDLPSVDLSAQYAITVLDQVVKKKIAEVQESLEAAKQDLIEELSENSETVIQIKDSPSEFQFKLQPESIPNDLPFLYESSSHEQDAETTKGDSPVVKSEPFEIVQSVSEDTTESKTTVEESASSSIEEPTHTTKGEPPVIKTEKSDVETAITVHEDDEEERPSPVPISRSGSDVDNKDESSSLVLPCPVLRRRHKPGRASKRVTSESEADVGSSSGDSSNYQSCDYEIGSGSRPSSSDIEALQSGGVLSTTASEYETAMMSFEHSSSSKQTSQEYHTAATTMSSRESMKSLTSLSSGHLGSIDSTSELSETLVASEADVEKEEPEEDFKGSFEEEPTEQSDSSGSEIPIDELMDKIDSHVPYRMKRSSEMIFPQLEDSDATLGVEYIEESTPKDAKGIDFATSTVTPTSGTLQSVDIMTSRVSEDGVQSVCTQVISIQTATDIDKPLTEVESKASELEAIEKDAETALDTHTIEPAFLEQKYIATGPLNESFEISVQTSTSSMIQQGSMSTSSTSGVSVSTVIEQETRSRHSPDSDSFVIVDKPDIIDDFIVVEEVAREVEEFDSEGQSIRISSIPQVSSKNYDRDLENLITESKTEFQALSSQPSKNNELFDFESQESPPQASNDDQYSQSYSDEEQYEGGKKWIEMQFHADARVYDIEYDRGPLEDIKEEEITDFEAGSSRFGSLGSHKESIGSVGSMRGSLGSTPDYDILASKKYFVKPSDHDNVSLSSLQEFENLESAVAAENSKKLQCGSHDSINNGSLPKRYAASRSGHGDDVSLSSLKDFEGLEKACREAHLIELRAREEEDLLEHESPENKYKLESLSRTRVETTVVASFNPSTSGSDDYEKRIKEIDEIIRIAQSNVEKFDRQDDTTEDISQIEIMDVEKPGVQAPAQSASKQEETKDINLQKESNIMETSTDSLELEDNTDVKHHPLCRSSDSLEMKTTLDFPSLSSDSLNNVRDGKEAQSDMVGHASSFRRISSDSLDMPLLEQQNVDGHERTSENDQSDGAPSDNSLEQRLETTETDVRNDTMRTAPSTGT
ncbi:uncharacterized protein LOC143150636 isoform X2 [Ptiloglossa arizonensis]|uniref:uncharacterized protein LOC143150636 isoform X2 n=1 Tax=Ptiloglossa arizonensis TaxID=3350558 RepID=UPI003FA074D5